MQNKNTKSEWENPHELNAKSALRDAACSASSWFCDCAESNIRRVDKKHPHPAIAREGWFCMGCLGEFAPLKNVWQPIETAPVNVTVLVYEGGGVYPAHYSPGFKEWKSAFSEWPEPTHWMPELPAPNELSAGTDASEKNL